MAWVDRAASWIESPDPVAPSRRRPLTTPLLLLLLNSVLGTVQAHVVCVASYAVVLHDMAPNRDAAKVAVDDKRRPQVGVTLMPGHSLVNVSDGAKVGSVEGLTVGAALGAAVGAAVGTAEGTAVGAVVGFADGAADGTAVGAGEGAGEGLTVGPWVGAEERVEAGWL